MVDYNNPLKSRNIEKTYSLHSPTTPSLEGLHLQHSALTPPATEFCSSVDASPQESSLTNDNTPSRGAGFNAFLFASKSVDLMDIAAVVHHRHSQLDSPLKPRTHKRHSCDVQNLITDQEADQIYEHFFEQDHVQLSNPQDQAIVTAHRKRLRGSSKEHLTDEEKSQRRAMVKTGFQLLCRKFEPIIVRASGTQNTVYKNTSIDLCNLREWDSFPTYEDIVDFTLTEALRFNFHEIEIEDPSNGATWGREFFHKPAPNVRLGECGLREAMEPFMTHLNELIRLATYQPNNGDKNWIRIDCSTAARKRRLGGDPGQKEPDRVAVWTDGIWSRRDQDEREQRPFDTKWIPCLMVGDYKIYSKFNYKMLEERGARRNNELQYVMNQIHDYMDMHHCRYGYVLTEKELIMFRRRSQEGRWGQLDFSKAIPLNTSRPNQLNAMMVLWYFHVKYAAMGMEPSPVLPTHYRECPRDLGGEVYKDWELELMNPQGERKDEGNQEMEDEDIDVHGSLGIL